MTTRAILIATNRSGSTFLNHALDSHIDIGWERGEPLTTRRGDPDPVACVDDVLSEKRGYVVVGCKLSYRYLRDVLWAFDSDALWKLGIERIIHLYRADAVRTTLSATLCTMAKRGELGHAIHTTEPIPPAHIKVDAAHFASECLRYIGNVRSMKQRLTEVDIPLLTVTYEAVIGGRDQNAQQVMNAVAWELCKFLGVERAPLTARLRRVNPQPAQEIVTNWDAVEAALKPYQGDLHV